MQQKSGGAVGPRHFFVALLYLLEKITDAERDTSLEYSQVIESYPTAIEVGADEWTPVDGHIHREPEVVLNSDTSGYAYKSHNIAESVHTAAGTDSCVPVPGALLIPRADGENPIVCSGSLDTVESGQTEINVKHVVSKGMLVVEFQTITEPASDSAGLGVNCCGCEKRDSDND